VDRLESKTEMIDAQSRARYRAAMQEIKGKIQQIEKKLTVLKNSSTDAYQDLKAGAEDAWREFEDGLKQAKDRFTSNGR